MYDSVLSLTYILVVTCMRVSTAYSSSVRALVDIPATHTHLSKHTSVIPGHRHVAG